MLTSAEIELVQSSFAKVAPNAPVVADLFYNRLFEIDPSLRPLFSTDIRVQGAKLMAMLTVIVKGLPQLDKLVPAAQGLAKRHVGYGVQDKDYATVGQALLWTLGEGLGPAFTDDVEAAWVKTYGILSAVMIDAAHAPA